MWTVTTLGETCKMYQPKTISAKEMKADGEYVVYGANGIIGKYDKYNHEEPQLLITCRGATCGSVNVSTPFSWINGNAMVIQPDTSKVSLRYMEYLFKGGIGLSGAITGSAQPQITRQSLNDITFFYPPLAEQQRIVAKLDAAFAEIDTAIAAVEKNAENTKAIINSGLAEIFQNEADDWEVKKLSEVCIVERGSSPRPIKQYFTNYDGVNWIKIGDTEQDGKYVTSTKQKITAIGAKKSRHVNVGDFILTNSMSYGRPYIMGIEGYIHDGWFVLRLNKDIDTEYFYYLLTSPYVQHQFHNLAAGAVVKNISGDLVKKTILPMPPLERQKEICKKIVEIEARTQQLKETYKLKFDNLNMLKRAILAQELQSEAA